MIDRFKIPIALSLVGIVLIIGGLVTSNLTTHPANGGKTFPKESLVSGQKFISVDVSGAVVNPGVYQVEEGSRIEEAIEKAGGFSDKANQEYISKYLNLAQKLSDGTKLYIPMEGEAAVSSGATQIQVAGTQTSSKININTGSQSELESLSGIGPVTASKIISGRPYASIDELLGKKIVGKAVYEKIKDSVVSY